MTIHIGLIGGGNITDTHARAVRAIPEAEIAAIYGANAEKVVRLCQECGGKPYQDFEAFLGHRPMDLVVIGSPSGLHATHGIAAAGCGLHVLTEKPIDVTTQGADALIQAAEDCGVKLALFSRTAYSRGFANSRSGSAPGWWASRFWRMRASNGTGRLNTTAIHGGAGDWRSRVAVR